MNGQHSTQVTSSTEETSTGNQGKAAAHVFIKSSSSCTGDDESTLTWRQDMDAALVSDKISYKDGGLTVKQGGYYYIYSQIVYSGNGSRDCASGWILHTVTKQTASELEEAPTPLMRNLQSTPSIRWGRPAYTTSSFYLEANTRSRSCPVFPETSMSVHFTPTTSGCS